MGILEARDLSLNLDGTPILRELNFDLWAGYIHAIVGPNGAGKSTLASTVMGLEGYRGIGGDLRFDGQSIRDWGVDRRARAGITMGWQEPARFEGLTVRQFLLAAAKDKSLATAREALAKVGLDPSAYLTRAVDKTLSGGERKKVELASILAMRPRLVLLDEPDSGIDIESLQRIFDAIRVLKEQGSTIVLITHSLAVLDQAEHAFLICHGRIVAKGVVAEIRQYFTGKCIPCNHQNDPVEMAPATTLPQAPSGGPA